MNFSKFLRTPFFIEYLRMTASILQQLLVYTFLLHIAGIVQVVKGHWSGKNSPIYLKYFTDLDLFLPCRLRKAYAVLSVII